MKRRLLAVPLLLAACAPAPGPAPSPTSRVERVGEGVLSTAANEYNPSLSPDGRTLVFARSEPDFRSPRILFSHLRGGRWSAPEPAPFAVEGRGDSDPTWAPDGRTLYFVSDRPAPGRDSARTDLDLWRVRRQGDGWGAPEHLGAAVNSPAQELGPEWHDGWLYFGSSRGGRARMLDLFRAREAGGGFGAAEAMEAWNSPASEGDPEFSPDGATVLFWSNRPGGQGGGDLFVSRRVGETWSAPEPAAGLNSPAFDFTPDFSRDGRWLYFASTRTDPAAPSGAGNGQSDLYRAPASAVLR
jgi:Tol biopolymer transport system component